MKLRKNISVRQIVLSAAIGAIYTTITLTLAPISFGPAQLRISEALGVLPFYFPGTIWGLFIGCIISNIVGGFGLPDIIFGSLATLLASFLTSKIKNKYLAPLPPVLVNAFIIGGVITWSTAAPGAFWTAYWINTLQVGLGQVGACYLIGLPLLHLLPKTPIYKKLKEIDS